MNSQRLSKNIYYLGLLPGLAKQSTCIRRQVGAIITTRDYKILSTGYNGVPKNFDHCIDNPCRGAGDRPGDTSKCMAVHAEINALLQCDRLESAYRMYCSCTPCFSCAKAIANTDITFVMCHEAYADIDGPNVLIEAGINLFVGEDPWEKYILNQVR